MAGPHDRWGSSIEIARMNDDRHPNIMALVDVLDGALGCVFGLLKLAFWIIVLVLIFAAIKGAPP